MARSLKDMSEEEKLYFNRYRSNITIQGTLYYADTLKIRDASVGNEKKVACFNIVVAKKNHKGIVDHKLYAKSYVQSVIDWLRGKPIGTWLRVEGNLESSGGRNYINVKKVNGFDEDLDNRDYYPEPERDILPRNPDDYEDYDGNDNDIPYRRGMDEDPSDDDEEPEDDDYPEPTPASDLEELGDVVTGPRRQKMIEEQGRFVRSQKQRYCNPGPAPDDFDDEPEFDGPGDGDIPLDGFNYEPLKEVKDPEKAQKTISKKSFRARLHFKKNKPQKNRGYKIF